MKHINMIALFMIAVTVGAVLYAPSVLRAEETEQYLIREDDNLSIIVYPAEELGREVVVQPDGNIELKLIGSVKAKGLTNRSLAKLLELRFASYVRNPQVSVIIKKFSCYQLFITGAVNRPGSFAYRESMNVMELVSEAGGVKDEASIKKIRVMRGTGENKQNIIVNLNAVMNKGMTEKDISLKPGDVVFVPQRGLTKISWFVKEINPWLSVINFFILIAIASAG